MKSKLTKLPKSRVKIAIDVPAKDIKSLLTHVYEEFAQGLEITGFRKGKAPRALTMERIGLGRLSQEVLNHVLNTSYTDALKELKLIPVSQPAISVDSFSITPDGTSSTDLKATIEVDVLPKVSLSGYKSIKVKPPEVQEIKDDDVTKVLEHLRRQKADLKTVDRVAKLDDWVDVSFKGMLAGVPLEKLASEHYPLVIGSKAMIPGFEDELVGMKKDGKKTFDIIFPKDYHAKDMAGKKVKFEVAIHEVKQVNLPELSDVFAKDFGHETLLALRAAIRHSLEQETTRKHQQTIESHAIEAALKKTKVDIPESLIETELDRIIERMQKDVEAQGMPLPIYLEKIKKTPADLRLDFKPQAEQNVSIGLMLGEVAKQEKLDTTAQDIAKQAVEKLVQYATK